MTLEFESNEAKAFRAEMAADTRDNWSLAEFSASLPRLKERFARCNDIGEGTWPHTRLIILTEETPDDGLEATVAADIRWLSDMARKELKKRAQNSAGQSPKAKRRAEFDDRVRAEAARRKAGR